MAKRARLGIAVVVGCLGAAGAAYADVPTGGASGTQAGAWGAQAGPAVNARSSRAIGEAGKRLFEMADSDQDNQIDRIEALDTATFLIKGLFLAADQNLNGRIDPSESLGLRERVQQQPMLTALLDQAEADQRGHFDLLARLVDGSKLAPIGQEQMLDAAGRVVSGLYARADRDGDNKLAPPEIHAAVASAVLGERSFQAVFQAADADRSGALSAREAARILPIATNDASFRAADVNVDQRLSPAEALVMVRLGLREMGLDASAAQAAPAQPQGQPGPVQGGGQSPQQNAPAGGGATPRRQ